MFSLLLGFQRGIKPYRDRHHRRRFLRLEQLESRDLLTAFTPAQIRHAYGIDMLSGDGSGQTIAVVDAYDAPNVAADFLQFNAVYGVSGTGQLIKENQSGNPAGPFPAYNSGWAQEIALDVEWAHAIAPGANILLVEANSNSFSDLFTAVTTAKNTPGVVAVSMSWGSNEFGGEASYDSYFVSATGHPVAFVASSGDSGAVTSYPAVSPNVLGVGGTTLSTLGSDGAYGSESGWNGSGGGISKYESKPSYQSGITLSNKRMSPDVAYDSDPNSGVYVIFNGSTYVFGGTSVAAPQWAGLVAIADQGRGASAQNPTAALDGAKQLLPALYGTLTNNTYSADFHDVTTGSTRNGRTRYSAGPGYDLVTGLGTPAANLLVPGLTSFTAVTNTATSGGGSGGGAGNGLVTHGLGENSAVGSQLASPTAAVLEPVDSSFAAAASFAEPGISAALSDVLFSARDADLQAGLHLLTWPGSRSPSTALVLRTLPGESPAAASLTSSPSIPGSAKAFAQDDDEPQTDGDNGGTSSDDQAVDLALVACAQSGF